MQTRQVEPGGSRSNVSLAERAYRIRRNALRMGAVQGQGYIAQALGVADVLAVAYFHAMRYRPDDPHWEERDRFLLSIGHYAIALYAVLIEAGILPEEEIETYGTDDSRLPMSGMSAYTPGMEITGGSLGHGLGIAVGFGLGLKRKKSKAFVYNLFSDGELGEGLDLGGGARRPHWQLDNLIGIVDVNNQQADGPSSEVTGLEPLVGEVGGVRLAYPAGRRQRHRCIGGRFRPGTRARGATPAHDHLRHQDGQGRAVPRGARDDPLPAGGRGRMGPGARCARRQPAGGSWTQGGRHDKPTARTLPEQGEGGMQQPKKRLTTSAMIASLAGLASAPGRRRSAMPWSRRRRTGRRSSA